MSDDLERFFTTLHEHVGTAPVSAAEAGVILDLTRVVAHSAERRYAPIAAYAAGLALGDTPPAEREPRLRAILAAVEQWLAEEAR